MKWRYLIVEDGQEVVGTNSEKVAREAAKVNENIVIDAQFQQVLDSDGAVNPASNIQEQTTYQID